jgi:hypothetical protein
MEGDALASPFLFFIVAREPFRARGLPLTGQNPRSSIRYLV